MRANVQSACDHFASLAPPSIRCMLLLQVPLRSSTARLLFPRGPSRQRRYEYIHSSSESSDTHTRMSVYYVDSLTLCTYSTQSCLDMVLYLDDTFDSDTLGGCPVSLPNQPGEPFLPPTYSRSPKTFPSHLALGLEFETRTDIEGTAIAFLSMLFSIWHRVWICKTTEGGPLFRCAQVLNGWRTGNFT